MKALLTGIFVLLLILVLLLSLQLMNAIFGAELTIIFSVYLIIFMVGILLIAILLRVLIGRSATIEGMRDGLIPRVIDRIIRWSQDQP